MTHTNDTKSNEELADDMQIEIQALGINLEHSLGIIKLILSGIFIIGIITLIHFW